MISLASRRRRWQRLRRPSGAMLAFLARLAPLVALLPGLPAWGASMAPAVGLNGMVVTAQHLASETGIEVLRSGGNAIDAAVAVGYALAVVYPAAGNLGGGGFMTVQMADGRKSVIDFRETAPLAATQDMYLGTDGKVIEGLSTQGQLAVAVPGTVSGLEMALARFGTRKRTALLAPAIRLAREGYALDEGDVSMLRVATEDFRQDPPSAAIFLKHGQPYEAGDRLVQTDLARTLERISAQGVRGFYQGPTAAAILASNRRGGGLLSQVDLDRYQARERDPIECDYRGYHIVSAPPPSAGGLILCEMLNVLEGYRLGDMGFRSAQAVQVQIEAMRHAYVDRNSYLGDPDFVDNPVGRLLDKEYAGRLRAVIDPHKAAVSAELGPGVAPHEGSNTTHYSIIDRFGNAVSVTYTLNGWFGARVMAAGTGVLLNDEMDDFTVKLEEPNSYGLVQGLANSIAPGKRPLSSMTPTVVTKDGKVVLVLGTPGGSRIITTVLHVIVNLIDYGMNLQEAVDAPRFHQQWMPESTQLEPYALSPDTQELLRGMGQKLVEGRNANHVEAILVGAPALGAPAVGHYRYYGANDPRRDTGLALGY
jgi:gamma-glutamyltranspeptidase/glutathione hydrolase